MYRWQVFLVLPEKNPPKTLQSQLIMKDFKTARYFSLFSYISVIISIDFPILFTKNTSLYIYWPTGTMVKVFVNNSSDRGSISKTQKVVLDASLLNTQHYKAQIKGKVEQYREGIVPFPIPRFRLPLTMVGQLIYIYIYIYIYMYDK